MSKFEHICLKLTEKASQPTHTLCVSMMRTVPRAPLMHRDAEVCQ